MKNSPIQTPHLDTNFYRGKSWGSVAIRPARDLPSLKLRHLSSLISGRPQAGQRLLEVGSGSGRILASIQALHPALELTGLDLSAEQVQLAAANHPAIRFVCGNGEALPFADNSYDYVIFFDYLEHIERPMASLREMQRVLKPGGLLHFVCPAERQSIYRLSSWLFGRHFKEATAGHIQQFTRRELTRLAAEAGFAVRQRRYSYHLLGSLLDYTLFTLMLSPAVYAAYWRGNPYYARNTSDRRSGLLPTAMRLGNAIAYFESRALARFALGACAVHLTAQKPAGAADSGTP